jgi:hypothetical protein
MDRFGLGGCRMMCGAVDGGACDFGLGIFLGFVE